MMGISNCSESNWRQFIAKAATATTYNHHLSVIYEINFHASINERFFIKFIFHSTFRRLDVTETDVHSSHVILMI